MSIYSGDELYDDEVTSGLVDDAGNQTWPPSAEERWEPEDRWPGGGLTYPDGSPQEQYHDDDPLCPPHPGEAPF